MPFQEFLREFAIRNCNMLLACLAAGLFVGVAVTNEIDEPVPERASEISLINSVIVFLVMMATMTASVYPTDYVARYVKFYCQVLRDAAVSFIFGINLSTSDLSVQSNMEMTAEKSLCFADGKNASETLQAMGVDDIPTEYLGRISFDIMSLPVGVKDTNGHWKTTDRWEYEAIKRWLNEKNTHPVTRERLTLDMLVIDEELKNQIKNFVEDLLQAPQEVSQASESELRQPNKLLSIFFHLEAYSDDASNECQPSVNGALS